MAQAYLVLSTRYNIPIDLFGDRIEFIEAIKPGMEEETVRGQLLNYLYEKRKEHYIEDDKSSEGDYPLEELGWEHVYGREPNDKLKCAVALELLLDIVNECPQPPEMTWALVSEIYQTLKVSRNKEEVLKNWGQKVAKTITRGPYSKKIEKKIEEFSKRPQVSPQEFWTDIELLSKSIKDWKSHNIETYERRLSATKKVHKDFNPNCPKWQSIFLRTYNVTDKSLQSDISEWANQELQRRRQIIKNEKIDRSLTDLSMVGLQHGNKQNIEAISAVLKELRSQNYKLLTLEEPCDTSWKPYIEFAQSLGRKKNWEPQELLKRSRAYCKTQGISNKSTPEKLSIIYLAKQMGFEVMFIDMPHNKKMEMLKERTNRFFQEVVNSPCLDLSNPITAVGGPETWVNNIKESYIGCLERSVFMCNKLKSLTSYEKITHIGGNLHLLDMKTAMAENVKKEVNLISLNNGTKPNPIIKALGKEILHDGSARHFNINISNKLQLQIKNMFKYKETSPFNLNPQVDHKESTISL
jgi:hypothetical protein